MLGDNIRRLRKEKKLSINKLSELSGVALGYLSMIENNKANPTMDKIDDIAQVLETTSSELLSTEEKFGLAINSIEKINGWAKQGLELNQDDYDDCDKPIKVRMKKTDYIKDILKMEKNSLPFKDSKKSHSSAPPFISNPNGFSLVRETKTKKTNKINTIAAHFDGEEFTDDDIDDIEKFIEFILTKKKK